MDTVLRYSVEILTYEPRIVHSVVHSLDALAIIQTSASIGVRYSDEQFAPVREEIEGSCFTVHSNEVVWNEDVWDCESRESAVEIHESCPSTPHHCRDSNVTLGEALGMS